jgi:hypothetical protein
VIIALATSAALAAAFVRAELTIPVPMLSLAIFAAPPAGRRWPRCS